MNPLALPQVYPGEHHALHAAVGLVPPLLMPVEAGRAVLIDLQAHIAQVVVIVARVHPAADDDAAPAIQSLGQLNGGFKTQGNLAEPVLHGQLVLRAAEGHAGHIFREGRRLICHTSSLRRGWCCPPPCRLQSPTSGCSLASYTSR